MRMQEHFSEVKGSQQAGGVTYFGFLSVFPVLALAFFAIGYVAKVFPDANDSLVKAINEVLPGLVGNGDNQIGLEDIQSAAGAVGLIGLLGVLYAGLGWLSSLRTALTVLFRLPERLQPNFIIGKLRDLISLATLGAVLILSVAASGVLTRMSRQILDLVNIEANLNWLVSLVGVAVGVAASTLLFFLLFRLLAQPPLPGRALWSGALLGAIGFEVLKQLSSLLLASTKGQPAFQAFGISLILVVWINYFSRVVLYAAAWAHTNARARAEREERLAAAEAEVDSESSAEAQTAAGGDRRPASSSTSTEPAGAANRALPFAVGGGLGAIAGALMARSRRR
ncbi:MAG: YihY/virulence factor BrkB family protein [Nocardioidaceae bacterium]|nr:YihY/virulence factor BrkB family protein [Nocardioidaceae bacterium]